MKLFGRKMRLPYHQDGISAGVQLPPVQQVGCLLLRNVKASGVK